jgi:hypothetical protein
MRGIYVSMRVAKPTASWKKKKLIDELERLRKVKGFKRLDMGDDDLLGGEVTVEDETSEKAALAFLEEQGFEFSGSEIEVTKKKVKGRPAITIFSKGPLDRDATVADLVRYLARAKDAFTEVDERDGLRVRGFFPDYDTYRTYRLPMAYAVSAAHALRIAADLTFLGESEGAFVTTDGKKLVVEEKDPQNLTDEDWSRLGDQTAIDKAYKAWRKR